MNAHAAERAERARHIANGVRIVGHEDFADGIARKVRELSNGDRWHEFYTGDGSATATGFVRTVRPIQA